MTIYEKLKKQVVAEQLKLEEIARNRANYREQKAHEFAQYLMDNGQGTEELAYYIERTWISNADCMVHDINTLQGIER